MYASQWRFVEELRSFANVRGSSEEFISFQATKAPCSVLTNLQTSPAFSSTNTLLTFEQSEHQINNIPGFSSEFQKKIDPEIVFCQSYGDNFINNTQLDESFWFSNEDSRNHVQFQGHNMPFYEHFSEDSKLPEENNTTAAIVGSWLPASISSQRNQDNHDKHSSGPSGAGGISSSSSNYVSRAASKGKRRIRWTKDLHEPFVTIVDRLGGPQKLPIYNIHAESYAGRTCGQAQKRRHNRASTQNPYANRGVTAAATGGGEESPGTIRDATKYASAH